MDGELFVKMDDVVSHNDAINYLKAAERIINILYDSGFDAKDVHDYLHQLIINDL